MSNILILLGMIISIIDYKLLNINVPLNIIGYFLIFFGLIPIIKLHSYFKITLFLTSASIIILFITMIPLSNLVLITLCILKNILNIIICYLIFYGLYEIAHINHNKNIMDLAENGFILNVIFIIYMILLNKFRVLIIGYSGFILFYLLIMSNIFIKSINVIKKEKISK